MGKKIAIAGLGSIGSEVAKEALKKKDINNPHVAFEIFKAIVQIENGINENS